MIEIGEGIFVETGFDGINVAAILTMDGIICIDAPSYPRDAREWVVYLERSLGQPVRLLILTDYHGDRILNTRWFNAPALTHKNTAEKLHSYEKRYPQVLIDSLQRRNQQAGREITHSPVHKPSMSYTDFLSLLLKPHTIELSHQPGPTPGNSWIKIVDEDILFVGDTIVSGTLPVFSDFHWHNWMDSLRRLSAEKSSYKAIVPGRGNSFEPGIIDAMIEHLSMIEQRITTLAEGGHLPVDYQEVALDILGILPPTSLPRNWVVAEFSRGLKRLHDQLEFKGERPIILEEEASPS